MSWVTTIFSDVSLETQKITFIWWVILAVSLFVFFCTMIVLALALKKRKVSKEKNVFIVVCSATGLTILLLVGALIITHVQSPRKNQPENPDIVVEVIGHMWWWNVRYFTPDGRFLFETANEITIPVNHSVHFKLKAKDVIHSFWVPAIAGKIDMIPGRTNHLEVVPKKLGQFRGQCAEFCGLQHAKMSLLVNVVEVGDFKTWSSRQQESAAELDTASFNRGKRVFKKVGCNKCHSVRPLLAEKHDHAPDLTHIASRETLAAVSLSNNIGNLAGWILDPQNVKPGTQMPSTLLNSSELKDLLVYLENLR